MAKIHAMQTEQGKVQAWLKPLGERGVAPHHGESYVIASVTLTAATKNALKMDTEMMFAELQRTEV